MSHTARVGHVPHGGRLRKPGRHTRRRALGARLLVGLGIAVLVLAVGAVGVGLWYQQQLDGNIERLGDPFAELPSRPAPAPSSGPDGPVAVNVLILGSTSRFSAGDHTQWATGGRRTAAIMLAHLPADRQTMQVVSLPRDSWVPIPGHGEGRINEAFSHGGPALMIQTVEQLTDVRIDHFAVTDFVSFVSVTDAVGGVQIRVPEPVRDGEEVLVEAGVHRMSGAQALEYTRLRDGTTEVDLEGVERQQNWMRAIMAKVDGNKSDVATMSAFFTAVSESVATDDGFTIGKMRDLLLSARDLSTSDVQFMTAPLSGSANGPDGQPIVLLDAERLGPLMASIANDTVAHHLRTQADELKAMP